MRIRHQQLMHLPVITESGVKLGSVRDIEIDTDNHSIRAYLVSQFLARETCCIVPAQIKSITAEKIIVDDAVLKESVAEKKKSLKPSTLDPLTE